jgi:hypothetical protein
MEEQEGAAGSRPCWRDQGRRRLGHGGCSGSHGSVVWWLWARAVGRNGDGGVGLVLATVFPANEWWLLQVADAFGMSTIVSASCLLLFSDDFNMLHSSRTEKFRG